MNELILIVEDNESILFNLKLSLQMNGYKVEIASNGYQALEKLKNISPIPDLILSDIMMPDLNGYDFFEILAKDERLKKIPFIFVSAKSLPNDIQYGKFIGVDDYITKPIDEENMLMIIKNKLQKKKKH